MKEIAVAKIKDWQNGQMQQIAVGDRQILLSKIKDKFYATGAFCTHYGIYAAGDIARFPYRTHLGSFFEK
ncbi:MAG: Rieske 2Fe-2S domain-containing protein [Xenococcaceae cyanobacterium MO_188.B32]|nr:Rieske 2Fe-2S domain-containing protein [Xenococcaceae cyanobacterium MO_188.B32]